ncbi:hypothetical protein BJ944DRAFT_256026 [Cunninghamella echinulata]|nr:hypothetical protein BJ944DRAFT_256026 [Cunninghamella echinulata]
MEHAVYNDLQDLKEDYEEIVEPLLAKYPDIFNREAFTFDHFQKATTLVASRAFEVDAYHGNAMVPFADIFNHKSGDEHVHFETDFDVCEQCGALDYCEHQYLAFLEQGDGADNQGKPEDGWTDEEMELDDEEVGEDDDEEDEEECDGPLEDLEQLELNGVNFWKDDDEEDGDKKDTCDMVLDKPVKAKEEIYNTYGDHPSIALLNKYGFCYDNNQNDYISVSEDHVVDLCLAVTKENLRLENKNKTDEALEELAMEKTRPRWEFFLINEPILCPKDEEDEEDEDEEDHDYDEKDEHMDEKEQHGSGCCGDKSEQCDNDHDNDCNDHEKEQCGDDCDNGCCDGDDSCGEKGQGKSYFANVEGLYEDTLTCLLHIMFIDQSQFDKFTKDVQNAVDYFDGLAQGKKGPNDWKMKKSIYQVCKGLSECRNEDYLDESGNSTSVQDDFVARKKTKNKREYYALTCRMNEKKIIEKSISYYEDMIQQCKPTQPAKRKPGAKKLRKMK